MPRKAAAKATAADSKSLTIKRYGNRRLYNTETGSYVNYQDLIALIRAGRDVEVVDSTTKEDVTKAVLLQLILEEEKNKSSLLPVPFLLQLLRSREESVQDFFRNHLAASFEAYLRTKEEFDKRFRSLLDTVAGAPQLWEMLPGADMVKSLFASTPATATPENTVQEESKAQETAKKTRAPRNSPAKKITARQTRAGGKKFSKTPKSE